MQPDRLAIAIDCHHWLEGYVPNLAGLAWVFLIRNMRFSCWGGKSQSAVNM